MSELDTSLERRDINLLAVDMVDTSREYMRCKIESARAKIEFDGELASFMPNIRQERPKIGYDMAILALLEDCPDKIRAIYHNMLMNKAQADGLEKVLDAMQARISLYQSTVKLDVNLAK